MGRIIFARFSRHSMPGYLDSSLRDKGLVSYVGAHGQSRHEGRPFDALTLAHDRLGPTMLMIQGPTPR
jgi:hypothetical protein